VKGFLLQCVESMLLSCFLRIPLMQGELLLPVGISLFLIEISNARDGVENGDSLLRRRQMGS